MKHATKPPGHRSAKPPKPTTPKQYPVWIDFGLGTEGVPPGISLTPCGLQNLPPGLWDRRDSARAIGVRLTQYDTALQWAYGDWLCADVEGHDYIPRERYDLAVEITGYSRKTLRNWASVANKIESSRRRDDLWWKHHAEVASLAAEDQGTLLEKAARNNWPVTRLREEV